MNDNIHAITQLVDLINSDPLNIPTAAAAARSVNYERSYLSKLFKKTTGITYNAYSNLIKIGFAAAELRETGKTISEVSDILGYSEPEAFVHAFKNVYGCSPTDYRRNLEKFSIPFYKIISVKGKGVMTMTKIEPRKIIGDNFLKLLELQPASIVMYCFLASFASSPTGMLENYNPRGNTLPCIEMSREVVDILPLSIDEIFLAILELEDVDLLSIVAIENDCFKLHVNPIPEKLSSNGTLNNFIDFIDKDI